MNLVINALGIVLVIGIVWWFFFAKPKAKTANKETVIITVEDGIYTPAVIKTKAGVALQLQFLRKDTSPCAETVIFEKLNHSETLPLNQPVTFTIEPKKPGNYNFTCQMGMYRGLLIVE